MELKDRIIQLRIERYNYLSKVLEKLNEQQLNLQPLDNKRSIAELLHHIGLVDGIPFFLAKIIQRLFFSRSVKNAKNQKLDGTDYQWNLDRGNKRTPKFRSKKGLEKQFNKNKIKIEALNYKEKDRKYRYFSERHANFHLQQLKFLLEKSRIDI